MKRYKFLIIFTILLSATSSEATLRSVAPEHVPPSTKWGTEINTLATSPTVDNNVKEKPVAAESEGISSITILMFTVVVLITVIISQFLTELNKHYIPESVCLIVVGVIIGVIISQILKYSKYSSGILDFNPNSFFLFLLPIIIYETGFSVSKSDFFKNLQIVLVIAIFGTLISFIGTSVLIYFIGKTPVSKELPWTESLIIGAITCATDPVAAISIFKALGVNPTLYVIVLGESILNDAVSLIIYKSVISYSISELWRPIISFIVVFTVSILVGVLVGMILALVYKYLPIVKKHPSFESIYLLIFAYLSYILADSLQLSGILSCFFSGMFMSQYIYPLASEDSKKTFKQILKLYSFIGEGIVFIYMGISVTYLKLEISIGLILWTFLFLIVTRAISIFPTFYLFKKFNILDISFSNQIVIWFSGLRGAISYSSSLSESYNFSEFYNLIQTTILIVTYLTIGVLGNGTYPLLKYLNMETDLLEKGTEIAPKFHYRSLKKFDSFLKYYLNLNLPLTDSNDIIENSDEIQLEDISITTASNTTSTTTTTTSSSSSSPTNSIHDEEICDGSLSSSPDNLASYIKIEEN